MSISTQYKNMEALFSVYPVKSQINNIFAMILRRVLFVNSKILGGKEAWGE